MIKSEFSHGQATQHVPNYFELWLVYHMEYGFAYNVLEDIEDWAFI